MAHVRYVSKQTKSKSLRRTQFCFSLNFFLERKENDGPFGGAKKQRYAWLYVPFDIVCQSNKYPFSVLIDEELSEEEVAEPNEANDSTENESESGDEMEVDNEDDEDGDGDDNGNDDEGNVGWANTFAKVLQQEKPKNKKYLVLSRAKKLAERKADNEDSKPALTFEIEGKRSEAEDADSNEGSDDHKPSTEDLESAILAQKERNSKLNELRVKPSVMDRERERAFKRIATKGVVQLFNAVRSQQRDLVDRLEKAGPLDHKRDAVLNNINKRQFLDVLMGGKRAKSENIDNPVKDEDVKNEPDADDGAARPSQWSVLRDDFMTNKKIASHWDNDDDEDDGDGDGGNGHGGTDADSDGDSNWNDHLRKNEKIN